MRSVGSCVCLLILCAWQCVGALSLQSPAFGEGQAIPSEYSCLGADVSPSLIWTEVPEGTASLALVLEDPDAPSGTFTHWVVWKLDPSLRSLDKGTNSGIAGRNDFGSLGYRGPCPPRGQTHRYSFRLFALDSNLSLSEGADRAALDNAIEGHVIQEASWNGIFPKSI